MMVTKGFDLATPLSETSAKQFKDAGYSFVCRYLVPNGWKHLSPEEAVAISKGGLRIVSVYETTADRALGGYEAGFADGQSASQCAEQVGQPHGSTIYFAIDFDAQVPQMDTVTEYIRGCNEGSPNYSTGVYGSVDVVRACQHKGVCSHFWQTYAWSRGVEADGIQIYQFKNDVTLNGKQVDLDEGYGNEGSWSLVVFKDVDKSHWAYEAIKQVSDMGVMIGYGDGTFKPEQFVTRAELAQVITNLKK